MLTDQVLERLDQLSLCLRDHARGGSGGVRRSRMLGSSAEFSDFREYAPGDDIRRIDWNAFARFDKLFLKLFMEEQEMCLTVLVDASGSMRDKWAFSVQLAEALAYLSLRGGDKVLLVAFADGREQKSRVLSGRGSFLEACRFLESIEPKGEAALDVLVPRVKLPPRGLCALISDLMMEGEGERALMSVAFKRQQLALLHVLSPSELSPEYAGAMRLVDSESEEALDLVLDRATLEDYQRALDAFLLKIRAAASRLGASYGLFRSDAALLDVLLSGLSALGIVR